MKMSEYNLALIYAKGIISKRPGAATMTAKERLEAARNRVNKSLLALARTNLARKEKKNAQPQNNPIIH